MREMLELAASPASPVARTQHGGVKAETWLRERITLSLHSITALEDHLDNGVLRIPLTFYPR